MEAIGYSSCKKLLDRLYSDYGQSNIKLVGQFTEDCDAFGWKFIDQVQVLYSISTHAGQLRDEEYDIMISISDDSLQNGEILVDELLSLENVLANVKDIRTNFRAK